MIAQSLQARRLHTPFQGRNIAMLLTKLFREICLGRLPIIVLCCFLLSQAALSAATAAETAAEIAADKTTSATTRLIVLADMGNEADEEQQIIHLLMCANHFDIEGLIAVSGLFLRPEHAIPERRVLHPNLFHDIIDVYAQVQPNLVQHAANYPTADALRAVVSSGQTGYGIAATGKGKSSPGSQLIIAAVTKPDPRPVHIIVNAGSNTLAQALIDYQENHTPDEMRAFVAKLRVFENGAQDNAGAWICQNFPDIFWVRSNYQTYCYGGPKNKDLGPHVWKPFPYTAEGQDAWADEHMRKNHGAFGARYPQRIMKNKLYYIEGGGTIPWMGHVAVGLTDADQPSWGGWSGRFSADKALNVWSRHAEIKTDEQANVPFSVYAEAEDTWTNPDTNQTIKNISTPVWRWRQAMWNDFQARMDWCVLPYAQANHHPIAVLNGDTSKAVMKLSARAGSKVTLSAQGSRDPDQQSLRFSWWHYQEAGQRPYAQAIALTNAQAEQASLVIPADATGKEIHIILEIWDSHQSVPLAAYRRAVIRVE
jgi:Protein of unknown function (DUF1593)